MSRSKTAHKRERKRRRGASEAGEDQEVVQQRPEDNDSSPGPAFRD